jgi:tetratricopeptide (TPR) repeat protein
MSFSANSSTSDFPDGDDFPICEPDGDVADNLTVKDREDGSSNMLKTKESIRVKSTDRHLASEHNEFAHTSYQLRNYPAALEAIDRAIAYAPDRTDFYYQRALIANALNNQQQVIADCQQILNLSPQHQAAQRLAAIALLKTKNYREALTKFDRYIESYPQDAHGYCYRGICHDRQQAYSHAIVDFNLALDLKPQEARFYHARGNTHQQLGNFSAALADYQIALQMKPLRAKVYDDRSEIYRLQGDCQRAIADCKQAIDLNPLLVSAYFRRGIIHAQLGDLDLALVDYALIIAIDADHVETYKQRSWIYFRRGEYGLAIQDCEAVKKIDKDCFWVHYLLGVINDRSGLQDLAIADFSKAISLQERSANELAPNDVSAYYHRGVIYYELGNHNDASADFDRAKSIQERGLQKLAVGATDPLADRDETGLYAEGLALYYTGQFASSMTMLKLSLSIARRYGNTRFQLQILQFLQQF